MKIVAPILIAVPMVWAQSAPSVETAKQALNAKWQKLKPDYVSERNVVFQDVQAGRSTGASFPFRVTALIRDYEPGYPPNHYYGKTCVGRIEQLVYTLQRDAFGGWDVQGAMTPNLNLTKCQNNPAAGVSSIPLASLTGSQAAPGAPAAAPPPPAPVGGNGGMQLGEYQCWGNGEARLLMNFTVTGAGRYTGSDGKAGAFSLDASSKVTFHGGALDGVMPAGFSALYYAPQGRPTVSFRGRSGAEAVFCQKK